ncbi:hypothetical protein UFOVP59_3 [uncultured Caudovirales phage]|uniref:Uncharacterized protein n=1 Tax=uncultured Caudovirales phage TaxID=2100421 RepID=A0A6J5KWQ5_9CAUD|nr:hypothetical protein UFOVP59_3 [uncultured Caudovirales phage]CAB5220724.1 hypothetical protein UFOVP246_29 [uncultured Caudovirales phage]
MYGRAYIQNGVVIALHVSDQPINIIMIDGTDLYDLELTHSIPYDQISFDGAKVIGESVTSCVKVS